MKYIVTGARGFIGKALCEHLTAEGKDVVPLSIRAGKLPDVNGDVIFHLAHDHREAHAEELITWYKSLEQHLKGRVARQIYISSYSARPDAISSYGKTKYTLEQYFLEQGHTIIRPGLVLGYGGTFGSMLKVLEFFPVIPVPGGNTGKVPYISLPRLCEELTAMPHGEVNMFSAELVGLKDLLKATAKRLDIRPIFLPFPAGMALGGLMVLERLGLQLPVRSDNLRGLIGNEQQIHFSNNTSETLEQALETL